ncbi:HAD family phosphatase [Yoonia sp. SS1-5]|uniref:phosphoglycolate phosphatase n=1 Tax=Yoonia rhodophyticola TaxID=3137370 RepID=A0AAN0MCQ9_9RHOB
MTPELVIFDCDGVLVDTEPVTDAVLSADLTRHGYAVSPQEIHTRFAGGTIAGIAREAREKGADLPDDWIDRIYETVFAALRKGTPVIPGVMELIHACDRAGIKRAIASNGPMAKMEITLAPNGLWNLFEGRIYSGHDHPPKPEPGMLLQIMADAGVAQDNAVMIDDMPAGFNAAKAAGIRCFGYVAEGGPARIGDTGAIPVTSMDEIARAIGIS